MKSKLHLSKEKLIIGSQNLINDKEIICQYCQKKFARKDNLTRHINKGYCKILRGQTHGYSPEITINSGSPFHNLMLSEFERDGGLCGVKPQ